MTPSLRDPGWAEAVSEVQGWPLERLQPVAERGAEEKGIYTTGGTSASEDNIQYQRVYAMANGDTTPLVSFVEHLYCGPFAKKPFASACEYLEVI